MPAGRPRLRAPKEEGIKLDLHPPKGQPKRQTNQLSYLSRTIMHALIRHDEAWPFLELLTPQKIKMPNYYEIVKRPMSLRVIKKRLNNGYYRSANDAIKDIRLVFKNAYKVSGPKSVMRQMAKNLYALFKGYLKSMPEPEEEIGPKGKPVQVVCPQIPAADEESDSVFDEPMDDHDHDLSTNTDENIDGNDGSDEHNTSGDSNAMMEFALRRLERLRGVDRSQARKAYSDAKTVVFEEVCETREIDIEMNEGHSSDAVNNIWMELETIEAEFAAYSKRTEGIIDAIRMACYDDTNPIMPDTAKVLADAMQDYSFSQE